jgi:methyl-accepting chemotaxis protein
MNEPVRRMSVRLKLSAMMAGVIFALVSFLVLYSVDRQHAQLTRSLEQKAESLARLAAHDLAPTLDFDDKEASGEVLKGLGLDGDVSYAGLFAADGRLLAEAQPTAQTERPKPNTVGLDDRPQIEIDDAYIQVTHRVLSRGGLKGMLVLRVTSQHVNEEGRTMLKTSALAGVATFCVGLVAAFWLGSSFGRRIRELATVAQRVARGELSLKKVSVSGSDEISTVGDAFNEMLTNLKRLEDNVLRVANGDLTATTNSQGDLAQAFDRMIIAQRELVTQIADTGVQVSAGAAEFLAGARQQEHGATEQSSAVEETRRTTEALLNSSREIARTAQGVLQNAEHAQENSQVVASRIAALSAQSRRISEILEVIKDIANKSDLLALNAALEGTKAGEAGRGFLLVATQMQRLAENVMGAVSDIKELTATIADSTQASVLATEESTKLAADTTRSVRQIALIIQQQQSGTEQVTRAMDDVAHIATQSVQGSKQVVRSTEDLLRLAQELQRLVGRFTVNPGTERRIEALGERAPQATAGPIPRLG